MKLSANVLTPETKPVPGMLAYCGALREVFPRLRDLGYEGVEFITVDPKFLDLSELSRLLEESSLEAVAVNTGRICGELGLTLSSPDPRIRELAMARARDAVDFASHWGIPINIGILRGQYEDGIPRGITWRLTAEALRSLCDYAAPKNVGIAIETVCFMQSNFINTLEEAGDMVRDVGRDNLGVMYDLFQMYIEEPDLCGAVLKYRDRCMHVHFADSNRLAPGRGAIDYPGLIRTLKEADYKKAASVEIRPLPDQDTAAKQAAEYLLPLL